MLLGVIHLMHCIISQTRIKNDNFEGTIKVYLFALMGYFLGWSQRHETLHAIFLNLNMESVSSTVAQS